MNKKSILEEENEEELILERKVKKKMDFIKLHQEPIIEPL